MNIIDFGEMTILLCLICFPFLQKFNLPAKIALLKECQMTACTLWAKNFVEIALSHTVYIPWWPENYYLTPFGR